MVIKALFWLERPCFPEKVLESGCFFSDFRPGLQFSYEKIGFKNNVNKISKPSFFIGIFEEAIEGLIRPLRDL